jgi:uncharacterized membrane protein
MKDSTISTQKSRIKTTSPDPAKAPRRQTQTDTADTAAAVIPAASTANTPAAETAATPATAAAAAAEEKHTASRQPAENTDRIKKKKTLSSRLKALFKNQVFRYTLLFLGAMILLYLFSMFGGMLTSPGFTYAEF